MWPVNGTPADPGLFNGAEREEVLYDFDGPRIFTARVKSALTLWYQCGEHEDGGTRFLVAPTEHEVLEELKKGACSVHEALSQPWIWVVDLNAGGRAVACELVRGLDAIPANAKPARSTPLWPHLMRRNRMKAMLAAAASVAGTPEPLAGALSTPAGDLLKAG